MEGGVGIGQQLAQSLSQGQGFVEEPFGRLDLRVNFLQDLPVIVVEFLRRVADFLRLRLDFPALLEHGLEEMEEMGEKRVK